MPLPSLHAGLSPAITRRAAASSVEPRETTLDSPCVLGSLGADDRETRRQQRKEH